MAAMRVMILTAVQIEAKAIARALQLSHSNNTSWTSGENQKLPISMCMIGMGARQLPAIEPGDLHCILMAGLAGGLSPSLQIGDLVIDERSTFSTQIKAVRGEIHTSRTLVATAQEKADCHKSSGAVAVDMENQIVREWAAKMSVPFLGIRAISDRADESLDPAFVKAIDELGRVKPVAFAGALLGRPQRIASLIRLGRHAKIASRRLGGAVAQVIAAMD